MNWHGKRYYSFDSFLKNHFGEKIYKVSLDGGFTCPNRDGTLGTGGCIFCSEGGSGDFASSAALSVTDQITAGINMVSKKIENGKYIAYFQAFTNTYAPVSYLRRIFMEAIQNPDIAILSIATRPDCLSEEVLSLLEELAQIKPVWIELGLQTIHPATTKFIRSGFSIADFDRAVAELEKRGIRTIVHLILGLPGETREMMLSSVSYVASLPVFGMKLQLLHILKGTDLLSYYEIHPFPLFSLEGYCDFVADCIALLPPDIVIHRLTGDGPKRLLAAPLWSADKKRVLNQMQRTFREKDIWQGKYCPHYEKRSF